MYINKVLRELNNTSDPEPDPKHEKQFSTELNTLLTCEGFKQKKIIQHDQVKIKYTKYKKKY